MESTVPLNIHPLPARDRLLERPQPRHEAIDVEMAPESPSREIVGRSSAMRDVLDDVAIVAPTDANVLIQGETGTGKELIARAIHARSGRQGGPFVELNVAAIPANLLEAELFGHERGAFTGAFARRTGRVEQAHGGTLFLDEIADLPLELQPKLLRVLQERAFERLGDSRTIRSDFRVVAATNRDLARMMERATFREDLYYRLNVFPIVVPPLRARDGDIPLLVDYFVRKYARRMGRRIERVDPETSSALMRHPWPGNVRELDHVIERAVIRARDHVLRVPRAELEAAVGQSTGQHTLEQVERAHILETLEASNWVIAGRNGAAERLGLKRTTLLSRMQKHGISRPRPRSETGG